MARSTWTGASIAKDVIKTSIPANEDELYAAKAELEAARDGLANLLAKIDQIDASVAALAAGSGLLISANDTTIGNLNGKAVAGTGIQLTENNDGGNETLTWDVVPTIPDWPVTLTYSEGNITVALYAKGVYRYRQTMTYTSTKLTSILWEYSSDSGDNYTSLGTEALVYTGDTLTSTTWTAS